MRAASRSPAHWPALNIVVRHDHVNGVFGSPLRHMAVDAGRTRACTSDRALRRGALLVAAPAHRNMTLNCLGTARNIVRVVAREARHPAALEARRLAQPVGAAGDLELVIAARLPRRMIEMNEVVAPAPYQACTKTAAARTVESETAADCSSTRDGTACTLRAAYHDRASPDS